jgi:hypothetical protein
MESHLISSRLSLLPRSLTINHGIEFGLAQTEMGIKLVILAQPGSNVIEQFEGENSEFGNLILKLCNLSHPNAKALRTQLNWLQPKLLGLKTSAGMGDRLGIATPGHVRAVRNFQGRIAPIFAQQSIREMTRTHRSPDQVMDDAMWGCFEEGWQEGAGCDADHLKTKADIDICYAAGFTFFTFDPGEYVDRGNQAAYQGQINEMDVKIPEAMQPRATGLSGNSFTIEGHKIFLSEEILQGAVLKYGRAVTWIVELYEHLKQVAGDHPFEVEVSMDETEQPTTPAEHVYIASEMHRLGVKWVSFAPRFVGRFEKGVDYIGDLPTFRNDLAIHAAIARQFGPYKLSLHSGSDKFSIYSIFMEETRGLCHLKTAGTSYLEALRTIAAVDKTLCNEIYSYALHHFEKDKLSYHTSAQIVQAPRPDEITDWTGLLEQFDAREILHITFGSVLTDKTTDGKLRFYDDIMSILQANRETYFDNLENHFKRHLQPFSSNKKRSEGE